MRPDHSRPPARVGGCLGWLGVLILAALALGGCSVGDDSDAVGGDGSDRPRPPVSEPTFSRGDYDIRRLIFGWNPVTGADRYLVSERREDGVGFELLAELGAEATSFDHEVFLPRIRDAAYLLESCEGAECTPSAEIRVGPNATGGQVDLGPAIGYVKAPADEGGDRMEEDQFGFAVALSADGTTLAVGAPNEAGVRAGEICDPRDAACQAAQADRARDSDTTGAVYVYRRGPDGWAPEAYIKPPQGGAPRGFGETLALSGDGGVLVVGAPRDRSPATGVCDPAEAACRETMAEAGSGERVGAAFVYERGAAGWAARAYLKGERDWPARRADFGAALALARDGGMVIIGAPRAALSVPDPNDPEGPDEADTVGAAYFFTRREGGWEAPRGPLYGSSAGGFRDFGRTLALSGDGRVIAVAVAVEPEGQDRLGRVLLLRSEGAGWRLRQVAETGESGDGFGASLALSGDGSLLLAGAPGAAAAHLHSIEGGEGGLALTESIELSEALGAVDVVGPDTTFSPTPPPCPAEAEAEGGCTRTYSASIAFGSVVALSDDGGTVVVGAQDEANQHRGIDGAAPIGGNVDPAEGISSGAAFVFEQRGSGLWQQRHLKAPRIARGANFGHAVALVDTPSGPLLAVGAFRDTGSGRGIEAWGLGRDVEEGPQKQGAVYLY